MLHTDSRLNPTPPERLWLGANAGWGEARPVDGGDDDGGPLLKVEDVGLDDGGHGAGGAVGGLWGGEN